MRISRDEWWLEPPDDPLWGECEYCGEEIYYPESYGDNEGHEFCHEDCYKYWKEELRR